MQLFIDSKIVADTQDKRNENIKLNLCIYHAMLKISTRKGKQIQSCERVENHSKMLRLLRHAEMI